MLKVIVFDFDGVIVDSNQLKYDAFFEIFEGTQKEYEGCWKVVEKVLKKHREASRYFIIENILVDLQDIGYNKTNGPKSEVSYFAEKYQEIVEAGAIECNEIDGAKESVEALSKRYALYVNSTTPDDSLKRIISNRGLSRYFSGVYGGPSSKMDNLGRILKKEGAIGKETLVVGDGESDLEAAQQFGCEFVGIVNQFNKFGSHSQRVLEDLRKLGQIIENI